MRVFVHFSLCCLMALVGAVACNNAPQKNSSSSGQVQPAESSSIADSTTETAVLQPEEGEDDEDLSRHFGTVKYIQPQTFTVERNDVVTTFKTENGIEVEVPQNAFLTNKPVKVVVKEALTKTQIAEAGLPTRSGDRLLESEGMFQITAFAGNKAVSLNPEVGLNVRFPRKSTDTTFKLFVAQPDRKGNVNDWQLTDTPALTADQARKKAPECPKDDNECLRCKTILKDYYKASTQKIQDQYFLICAKAGGGIFSLSKMEEKIFNQIVKRNNSSLSDQKKMFSEDTDMFYSRGEKRDTTIVTNHWCGGRREHFIPAHKPNECNLKFDYLTKLRTGRIIDLDPKCPQKKLSTLLSDYLSHEGGLLRFRPYFKGTKRASPIVGGMFKGYLISAIKVNGNGDSVFVKFSRVNKENGTMVADDEKNLWTYSKVTGKMMLYSDASRFNECNKQFPNYYAELHPMKERIQDAERNVYRIMSLGWYNIDRFYKDQRELLSFKGQIQLDAKEKDKTLTKSSLTDKREYMSPIGFQVHVLSTTKMIQQTAVVASDASYTFSFAKDEPVKIIIRGNGYAGVWEGTLEGTSLPAIVLKPIAPEEIKNLFANL